MIKQAYYRGLAKRAGISDFFVGQDSKWYRGGGAALLSAVLSRALGADWATTGAIAAGSGVTAYNTHNAKNLIDYLSSDSEAQSETSLGNRLNKIVQKARQKAEAQTVSGEQSKQPKTEVMNRRLPWRQGLRNVLTLPLSLLQKGLGTVPTLSRSLFQ